MSINLNGKSIFSEAVDSELNALESMQIWKESQTFDGFPFLEITAAIHETGKHFATKRLIEKLSAIRADCISLNDSGYEYILRYLDIVLDKHDGVYDYRSYLALSLLELPTDAVSQPSSVRSREMIDRTFVLLISDVVRFELTALSHNTWMTEMIPDSGLVEKRVQYAQKILAPYVGRMNFLNKATTGIRGACFRNLLREIDLMMTGSERRMLHITNLPVYKSHDEYIFIRIVQCFEYVFSWIVLHLRDALSGFSNEPKTVVSNINCCTAYLKEAHSLFRLLGTIRPESFRVFREYTEGASAIQSRNYKLLESLCCLPKQERIDSIAYDSVPEVKAELNPGKQSIDSEYLRVKREKEFTSGQIAEIRNSMEGFEVWLKRWRLSHYGVAVAMLGQGPGTGYTEGTPYLEKIKSIPVFSSLNDPL